MRNNFSKAFFHSKEREARALDATWRHTYGRARGPNGLSLDEALELIDQKNRQRDTLKRRAAERIADPEIARGAAFRAAKMIAASAASKAKVKMPEFSFTKEPEHT